MADDRNTIVTHHKKGESNSCIEKKLHVRSETVWKVVKIFKETGETCNRPGQGRKRTVRTKRQVNNTREKLRRNSRRSAAKLLQKQDFNESNPQEDLGNLSLQNAEKAWTFNHSWRYETWQMWTHSNLMKDETVPNLVFTDEKKFAVQQCLNHQNDRVWSRDGSVEGRRVSRRRDPLSVMVWAWITATRLGFVHSGVKLNSQRYISDILEDELLPWARKHYDGAPWTLQDSAPSLASK